MNRFLGARPVLKATSVIQLYCLSDGLTGVLIFLMAIFSPWAFGTTEPWSVWTMNAAGICLGLLLAVKLIIRRFTLFARAHPERPSLNSLASNFALTWLGPSPLTRVLVALTCAICGYFLLSALNARATWHPSQSVFVYHPSVPWLPHSLDSTSTWLAFWTSVGLVCSFWALRDWLLNTDARPANEGTVSSWRLRHLLWLLSVNGALLALEGILQRFFGGGRLLFLVQGRFNPEAVTQFGPYAYRGNAAQYFNLLWPVCLGFWWTLYRTNSCHARRHYHHWLLLCAAVMAACPIISSSRGGTLICLGLMLGAVVLHLLGQTHACRSAILVLAFLALALGLGFGLGWKQLGPRLAQIEQDYSIRQQLYEKAKPMAADYPWFGTGPGTFENLFQFYRRTADSPWPAQLHNDWLETRITLGWIGMALLGLAFAILFVRSFPATRIAWAQGLTPFIWLALAGVLVHARFDFPFQVYSIVLLCVVLCGILLGE